MDIAKSLCALLLAQFATCAAPYCGLVDDTRFVAKTASVFLAASEYVSDAAPIDDRRLSVVVARDEAPSDFRRTIVVDSDGQTRSVAEFRFGAIVGDGLDCGDGACRYTAAGVFDGDWCVVFVDLQHAGSVRRVLVPRGRAVWLPVGRAAGGGVYVVEQAEQTSVFDVTPEGVQRRWDLGSLYAVAPGWWSAAALPDGSIAITSLDRLNVADKGTLTFRVLRGSSGSESVDEVFKSDASDTKVNSTSGSNGVVCIALNNVGGALTVIVVDPDLRSRKVLRLAEPVQSDRAPRVIETDVGFVVAWVDVGTGEVRARSIVRGATGLMPALVGSATKNTAIAGMSRSGDELVTAIWQDGARVRLRRLPSDVSAFELFERAFNVLCKRGVLSRPH